MVIAFLRGKNKILSTSAQQDFIIKYAQEHHIAIKMTEIDNNLPSQALEKRNTLLDLLNMLKEGDTLLIYDLWVLSQKVGELAKIFDCILRHKIVVQICQRKLTIDTTIPSGVLINLLSQQREKNLIERKSSMGRPKGSFSKSKFDKYKSQIVTMIQENLSVSEIAKRLEVSRSSLKDYINSRSLKDIALSKAGQHKVEEIHQHIVFPDPNECPLTDKKISIRKEHG